MIRKLPNPFSLDEGRRRHAACRAIMSAQGIDVFIVSSLNSLVYLTAYTHDPGDSPQALILTPKDEIPYYYMRDQDTRAAKAACFLPNDRIISYPERFVGAYDVDGFDFILGAVRDTYPFKRVGIEGDGMSVGTYQKFLKYLGDAEIVDLSGAIDRVRLVKSSVEVQVMREAGEITDLAMQRAAEIIRPGLRECDVAADLTAVTIRGTPKYGGGAGYPIMMPGGEQTGTGHILWTEQPIEVGKHYNVELSGWRHRYACPLSRTFSLGRPSAKLERFYSYVREGLDEALAVFRPGSTCGDVATAVLKGIARGGYEKQNRSGYPIGINWLEGSCSIRPDDQTVLQPDMTFHLLINLYPEETFGAHLSESLVVTETGYDRLCQFRRELIVM